jgi:hypothetical protein
MVRRLCGLALLACVGCAARFDGRVYRSRDVSFSVASLPSEWRPLSGRDAALAFRDADAQGVILVNGRCGLTSDDVPLSALTQHLFIEFTHRTIEEQTVVPFDGREAMHTRLTADLDGVPMRYDVWVLKKDGCVYDLLYVAPTPAFERGVARFGAFVKGFTTVVPHE